MELEKRQVICLAPGDVLWSVGGVPVLVFSCFEAVSAAAMIVNLLRAGAIKVQCIMENHDPTQMLQFINELTLTAERFNHKCLEGETILAFTRTVSGDV